MTMTSVCPECGADLKPSAKFCGACGSSVASVSAAHAAPQDIQLTESDREYIDVAKAVLGEGLSSDDAIKILLENAYDFGIDRDRALQLIAQAGQSFVVDSTLPIRMEYDASMASSGVANGNTLIVLRFENQNTKLIKSLGVFFRHPETNDLLEFPSLSTLVKGSPKQVELPVVLNRVGYHSIRDGFITIRTISGDEQFIKVTGIIRLSAENSQASRANINSFSSTIQTHGGGVIDASGGQGPHFHEFAKGLSNSKKDSWESLSLSLSTREAFAAFAQTAASSVSVPAAVDPPTVGVNSAGAKSELGMLRTELTEPEAKHDSTQDGVSDDFDRYSHDESNHKAVLDNAVSERDEAVYRFFSAFSFVTQYCQESKDRPLHVINPADQTGNVSGELLQQLNRLLPGRVVLAICEDDTSSRHDQAGSLVAWEGLATVISSDGLHHVRSSAGELSLDGEANFLSWRKYFNEIEAGLVVRTNVPDMWLGTKDHILVKGSYVDYSVDIDGWIYYNNYIRKDLIEKYTHFRQVTSKH